MALALGLAVRMSSSADGKAGDTLKALLAASRPLEELLAARRRDGLTGEAPACVSARYRGDGGDGGGGGARTGTGTGTR